MRSISIDVHLPPKVSTRTKTLSTAEYGQFELIQIGDYPCEVSFMTGPETLPSDLENIARSFKKAAQSMRERQQGRAGEPECE